ncbi:hypothetical protein [Nocardia sp. NPDC050717]|uniref:hypothetical protein n=1 Tax=Nocardia sp. NPDC050717 TaxID=3157221 RepID=UPI0033C64A0A
MIGSALASVGKAMARAIAAQAADPSNETALMMTPILEHTRPSVFRKRSAMDMPVIESWLNHSAA